jgi:hypothetical protein
MSTTPVDKRNFYLSLSIIEGQKLASSAGFSVPSGEVQESEIIDTIRKWLVMTAVGAFDHVKECADWMMEIVQIHNDLDDDDAESTKNVLVSFGMGLISHLVDNEILGINTDLEEVEMTPEAAATFISMMTSIEEDTESDE